MRKALEDWSDGLSRWERAFTAMVVLGLAIEYLPQIGNAIEWMFGIALATIKVHTDFLSQMGGFLVIVGVAGELFVSIIASRVETDLREETNEVIAKAEERAAEALRAAAEAEAQVSGARAEAEGFRLGIAKANESAEESRRIAESERLARVKIEERMGGWRLSSDAAKRLTESLKAFPGTEFEVFVDPTETPFFNTLDKVLSDAGWKRLAPRGEISLNKKAAISFISGFFIEFRVDLLPKYSAAVTALANGLLAEGISVRVNAVNPGPMGSDTLHIVIGRRE
jgi:hypothetical protein